MDFNWQKVAITTVILLAIFLPLERLIPVVRKKIVRPGMISDIAHLYLTGFLVRAVQGVFIIGIAFVLNNAMKGIEAIVPAFSYSAMQATVRAQPIALQIAELLILGDFFAYWAHRAQHEVRFLWRFHAIHHSPDEMDWLVTPRVHPIDQAIKASARVIPGFLLGFSIPALGAAFAIMSAFLGVWVFVVHANVKLKLGWLEYLHITPRFHHWHHALSPVNKNYADQFPIWDLLFGSFHLPKGQWPEGYGVHAPVPLNWALQMLHPFNPKAVYSYQASPREPDPVAIPAE